MMTAHARHALRATTLVAVAATTAACLSDKPEGLAKAQPASTTVEMDFFHRPLPSIPLPNDIATRFDETSATRRRINASMIAPTKMERRVRTLIDRLDGWTVFGAISIPFSAPLDVQSVLNGHRDADFDPSNDVVYLINVDKASPRFGQLYHLDLGNGNYPVVLEKQQYWDNDPRGWTLSLLFEEEDEDKNGNGVLDPGEDTDADGVLDVPNYLPGMNPARSDLAGRADALMTFYEKETHTLIARPLIPLDERTTYAVVVTRRLLDANGEPVGSPFEYINDTSQTLALQHLPEVLPAGLSMSDVAFTWSFTTQTVKSEWVAVRDGLYGQGVQKHLGEQFPAELSGLESIRDPMYFPDMKNPHVMYTENWLSRFEELYSDIFEADVEGLQFQELQKAHEYIDYHVVGSFKSPQLFQRADEDGKWLPYHDQVWPADLDRIAAATRDETVYFWLTVPRKEVSARGQGKPAPIVILGHGYTSSRIELLPFAGFFAKHGLATLSIDCVSHGVGISEVTKIAAEEIFADAGLRPFVKAALKDRASDQNGDLVNDSGADFWTAYLFHTRDVVRQSALDYMQLIRVIRSFDGSRRWSFDVDGDGQTELAGDFDADGQVDIGLGSPIGITGGSLGGIMALVLGGVEPEILASVPIAGGGGLSDIGVRSQQGGVREAVVLRMLAPLYLGTQEDDGTMRVEFIVPDLNSWTSRKIATLRNVKAGDTVVVHNLTNGERSCGYVSPDGRWRVGIESDRGDVHRIDVFDGIALVPGSDKCEVQADKTPFAVVDKFERDIRYHGDVWESGDPLVALEEGFGLRRANPETRRFMGIAQLALDPADPAVMSVYAQKDPIVYPATGQSTQTHMMVVTTVGDMNVPASSGLSIGRAAGLIDYLNPSARLGGKTENKALVDNYMAEAVNTIKRFTFDGDPAKTGVHMDVENFAQGRDLWGTSVPRLSEPVRAGILDGAGNLKRDPMGGVSGAIFPYASPEGEHGFAFPGELTDKAVKQCLRTCTSTAAGDPCDCNDLVGETYDVGFFMFNMLGSYFASGGKELSFDYCNSSNDCASFPPPPTQRDPATLR